MNRYFLQITANWVHENGRAFKRINNDGKVVEVKVGKEVWDGPLGSP